MTIKYAKNLVNSLKLEDGKFHGPAFSTFQSVIQIFPGWLFCLPLPLLNTINLLKIKKAVEFLPQVWYVNFTISVFPAQSLAIYLRSPIVWLLYCSTY